MHSTVSARYIARLKLIFPSLESVIFKWQMYGSQGIYPFQARARVPDQEISLLNNKFRGLSRSL
jgi:hypothetical protein